MHKVDWRSQEMQVWLWHLLIGEKRRLLFAVFDGDSNHDVATADRETAGLFTLLCEFSNVSTKKNCVFLSCVLCVSLLLEGCQSRFDIIAHYSAMESRDTKSQ